MQQDISDIYSLAKRTTGVFVNIALQEPFGLTLIEAAVHGAPIVATKHGGPVDIIKTLKACNHGPCFFCVQLWSCITIESVLCVSCWIGNTLGLPLALLCVRRCHGSAGHLQIDRTAGGGQGPAVVCLIQSGV